MKRVLFIITILFITTTALGQTYFQYNKYINGYWGDTWEDSNNGFYSEYTGRASNYGYVLKGTYDDFIIYYKSDIGNNYPSDYIMRVKIIGLNTNIDKKEKKEGLKKGVVSIFWSSRILYR